jgi:hypothetical protein
MTETTPELAAAFNQLTDPNIPALAEGHTFGGVYQVHMSRDGRLFFLALVPGPAAAPITWTTHRSYGEAVHAMADALARDEAEEMAG